MGDVNFLSKTYRNIEIKDAMEITTATTKYKNARMRERDKEPCFDLIFRMDSIMHISQPHYRGQSLQ